MPGFRGDRLRRSREAAGLDLRTLTLALELSTPERVRQWERGLERPRPRFIPLLARAVGLDPLELLDVDVQDPPLAGLRLAAGLSIPDITSIAGVSRGTFQRLEGGWPSGGPPAQLVQALAAAFGRTSGEVEAAIRRSRADVAAAAVGGATPS